MKVLTVVKNLGIGGTERTAVACAVGYQNAGLQSAVLAYENGGPRVVDLAHHDIPTFVGRQNEESIEKAVGEALHWNADVIHIHRTGYPEIRRPRLISTLKGERRKILETNVFARYDPSDDARHIDVHLMLSEWCLWKYRKWSRFAEERPIAATFGNPTSKELFYRTSEEERNEQRRRWGIPGDSFIFGRIGQPSVPKWSPHTIRAFEQVAKIEERAHLVLLGFPGQDERYLQTLPLSARQRVHLLPVTESDDTLRQTYSAFDVFLHTSRIGESFGLVLCEAMLCGTPVITLSTTHKDNSQVEIVGHGRGGLVVRSPVNLPEAMRLLMLDRNLHEALSRNSRDWVLSRFDTSVLMPKLITILEIIQRFARRDMGTALQNEGFVTDVDWKTLEQELDRCIGTTRWHEDFLRRLVHHPMSYGFWRTLKYAHRAK